MTGYRVVAATAIPVLAIGGDFAVAWPTWMVLNTDAPVAVMWIVAFFTMAAASIEIYLISWAVERRRENTAAPARERLPEQSVAPPSTTLRAWRTSRS
jgi:hypothetical protein